MTLSFRIVQDDPINPREWDNVGTMLYTSSKYVLGDKRVDSEEIDKIQNDHNMIWLPVYAYIHGGISLNTVGFSCMFDSGQCGIIYVSRPKARDWWGKERLSAQCVEKVKLALLTEIETFSQYLQGDVWGYIIEDEHGKHVDSCWGFYGSKEAENAAKDAIKSLSTSEGEVCDVVQQGTSL